ncbi:MAG: TetR family transcriptional regulator [Actinobacteria bacterium]|nr:TetR family transcriptional regulator [Actinomycetota bacterium]
MLIPGKEAMRKTETFFMPDRSPGVRKPVKIKLGKAISLVGVFLVLDFMFKYLLIPKGKPSDGCRRERKKREMRDALEEAAFELFKTKGYDQTKIEDITEAVDVSRRTFFRYFDSKESILFGDWRSSIDYISSFIMERPENEHPLVTIKELALLFAEAAEADRPRMLFIKELEADSKTLGSYERDVIRPAIEEAIANSIARRLGVDIDKDIRPNLYANLGSATLYAAKLRWMKSGFKGPLRDVVDEAFDVLLKTQVHQEVE